METKTSIPEKELKSSEQKPKKRSYWETLLNQYEKRNATLEKQQAALAERVKFMECALPSLLMGAVMNSSKKSGKPSTQTQESND